MTDFERAIDDAKQRRLKQIEDRDRYRRERFLRDLREKVGNDPPMESMDTAWAASTTLVFKLPGHHSIMAEYRDNGNIEFFVVPAKVSRGFSDFWDAVLFAEER
jgi:hypothetical protein